MIFALLSRQTLQSFSNLPTPGSTAITQHFRDMATIVYDGAGGGGTLFQGHKFHILQRVPDRNRWKALVESNGGELVPLEKQASIVIADHAKSNAPPGSISWRFIDQSVKKGVLEELEDHPAGPAKGAVRAAGSTMKKTGRVPFTKEDDEILLRWCSQAERKGAAMRGNELYKELEKKYPHHTNQSWRDRWVKYVSRRARDDEVTDNESDVEEEEQALPPPPRHQPVVQPKASRRSTEAQASRKIKQKPPSKPISTRNSPGTDTEPFVAKSSLGMSFTKEEMELLEDSRDDIRNIDEAKMIDAWLVWAGAYPSHTAQEWRNQFNQVIRDRKSVSPLPKRDVLDSATAATPQTPSSTAKSRRRDEPATSVPVLSKKTKDSEGLPDSIRQTKEIANGQMISVDPTLTNETLFKHDLELVVRELGLRITTYNPTICGRKIPLFRIWQTVMSDDLVDEETRWTEVARRLNFNDFRHANAASELEACYTEILADFENCRSEYRRTDKPGVRLPNTQEEATVNKQHRDIASDDSAYRIREGSPPNVSAGLGDHDVDLDSLHYSSTVRLPSSSTKRSPENQSRDSSPYNKRQRIYKGRTRDLEIPSTPDVIRSTNSLRPSPLHAQDDEKEASSSENDLFVARGHKESHQRPKTKNPQPRIHKMSPSDEFEDNVHAPLARKVSTEQPPARSKVPIREPKGPISSPSVQDRTTPDNATTPSPTASEQKQMLKEYVEQNTSLGYSYETVGDALTATSMVTSNATLILEALHAGKGIPKDIPGVWTSSDDGILIGHREGSASKAYRRVVLKHGKENVELRRNFLKASQGTE